MLKQEEWPTAEYELTEQAFGPYKPGGTPVLLQPGDLVTLNNKPGPQHKATCAEGHLAKERAGAQNINPLNRIALNGHNDDDREMLGALRRLVTGSEATEAPAAPRAPAPRPAPVAGPTPPAAPPAPPAPPPAPPRR
jgi:hypothetical protein